MALVLPFVKPGKDAANAENYRPIALTSHLCKWMEKMIVYWLSYLLEEKHLLNEYQSGFRKGRSTTDALIKVTNDIEKTLNMKEVMVIVFFDIEKAYDSMWREGPLIKMNKLGIGGRLSNWIMDFLTKRTFKVKVGSEISDSFDIVNGIPQGSVISPILFNIMINDIFENIGVAIQSSVYADDGAIWKKEKNPPHVLKCIQKAVTDVARWSYDRGFKISVSKSCYMLVTKKKIDNKQVLTLYSKPMERVRVFKYLGLWIDDKYTWKNHIEKVETKCKKVLNLMRCLAGLAWGADREVLLHIYRALLRATLDYGCMVFDIAAKSHLQKLDRMQYRALRLCLGAVNTTPINALLVESSDLPLNLRRTKLSLAYWIRIQGKGNGNIASSVLQNCWEYVTFTGKGFGWEINKKVKQYKLDSIQHSPAVIISSIPP